MSDQQAMDAQVFYGGPESPRALRDLLEQRIDAVPAGGEIAWVTYYFRDERLADALVRAHRRGVSVRVAVEGRPRHWRANASVIARLESAQDGIGRGLRVLSDPLFAHVHEKLYCFSHPRPVALLGSFNPSGNEPEDASVLRAIGDQDRGYNLLVELAGDAVGALFAHARWMHDGAHGLLGRFAPQLRQPICTSELSVYFFPRRDNPLDMLLSRLGAGARLRIAVSHLRDGSVASRLTMLAAKGVRVEVVAEATHRRVPRRIERALLAGGVRFRRADGGLPMHDKFLIGEDGRDRWATFGSYNLTLTSRWLNHEILAMSRNRGLIDALASRWDALAAAADAKAPDPRL